MPCDLPSPRSFPHNPFWLADALSGVGNRLMGLSCALGLAERLRRNFHLCWRVKKRKERFHCPLAEICEHNISLVDEDDFEDWCERNGPAWRGDNEAFRDQDGSQFHDPVLAVGTFSCFAQQFQPRPWIETFRRYLRFHAWLHETANRIPQRFQTSRRVVGLQVRKIRAHPASGKAKSRHYFRWMDEMLLRWPDLQFFLSADSSQTHREFIDQYGSRIFYQDKQGGFNSVLGVQEAIVDCLVLAQLPFFLRSTGSALGVFAGELQGKDRHFQLGSGEPPWDTLAYFYD